MAVTLTGTGGLFTRLGKTYGEVIRVNAFRGSSLTTAVDGIQGQYQSANQEVVDNIRSNKESYVTVHNSYISNLIDIARKTVCAMAHEDAVLANKDSVYEAWSVIISQMISSSDTVKANTVSVSVSAGGSNVGDVVMISSVVGKDGKNLEYVFPETVDAKVTTDRFGGATEGQESITLTAEQAAASSTDYTYPDGSGVSVTTNVVNYNEDAGTNLLTNSNFEAFTSNIPDNWNRITGTAGTTIAAGGADSGIGKSPDDPTVATNSLKIIGNGSELTTLEQLFDQSAGDGTTVALKPSTVYAFNCFVKMSTTPSAGVIAFKLWNTDPAVDAVISDDNSTANTISKALTSVSTSYVAVNGFFRTPSNLPDTDKISLRIALTTALDNSKYCLVAGMALAEADQLYTGGPYFKAFRGDDPALLNDSWTITVSNNSSGIFGSMSGGKIQTMTEALFGMRQLGLQLPSSGSPTVSDSLVS